MSFPKSIQIGSPDEDIELPFLFFFVLLMIVKAWNKLLRFKLYKKNHAPNPGCALRPEDLNSQRITNSERSKFETDIFSFYLNWHFLPDISYLYQNGDPIPKLQR